MTKYYKKDCVIIFKKKISIVFILYLGFLIGKFACSPSIFEGSKPPVITRLEVSAYEVDPGDTVRLNVSVQNEDNRILRYEWSCSGGQFIPPVDRAEIKWKAPAVGGEFLITVEVSNDKKSATYTDKITVRSYLNPYIEIISPANGTYFVQYSTISIKAEAQHNNGINHVNLYINDIFRDKQTGHSAREYNFMYQISESAGIAEIKVEAIANITGTTGRDSLNIVIEGIVVGKD